MLVQSSDLRHQSSMTSRDHGRDHRDAELSKGHQRNKGQHWPQEVAGWGPVRTLAGPGRPSHSRPGSGAHSARGSPRALTSISGPDGPLFCTGLVPLLLPSGLLTRVPVPARTTSTGTSLILTNCLPTASKHIRPHQGWEPELEPPAEHRQGGRGQRHAERGSAHRKPGPSHRGKTLKVEDPVPPGLGSSHHGELG